MVTEGWHWAARAQGWGGSERKGGCFRESATTKRERKGLLHREARREWWLGRDKLAGRALCPHTAGREGESCSWRLQGPALSASTDVTSS